MNINNIVRHAHQLVLPFSFLDGFLYAPVVKCINYSVDEEQRNLKLITFQQFFVKFISKNEMWDLGCGMWA